MGLKASPAFILYLGQDLPRHHYNLHGLEWHTACNTMHEPAPPALYVTRQQVRKASDRSKGSKNRDHDGERDSSRRLGALPATVSKTAYVAFAADIAICLTAFNATTEKGHPERIGELHHGWVRDLMS